MRGRVQLNSIGALWLYCNISSSPVIYYCEALMQDRFFGVFH